MPDRKEFASHVQHIIRPKGSRAACHHKQPSAAIYTLNSSARGPRSVVGEKQMKDRAAPTFRALALSGSVVVATPRRSAALILAVWSFSPAVGFRRHLGPLMRLSRMHLTVIKGRTMLAPWALILRASARPSRGPEQKNLDKRSKIVAGGDFRAFWTHGQWELAQVKPTRRRCLSCLSCSAQFGANLAQVRPNLADFGPDFAHFG